MTLEENTTQEFNNLINPYTGKPVQTGKSVSFNQRIYDDKNYIQAKNELLGDFNNDMAKSKSINEQALYDIPVIPEFLQKEYVNAYDNGANWLDKLNIASPDEIDEWRAMGKVGIGETARKLASLKSAKYIPFVGTTADVGYNLDMLKTMNRMKKGQEVSQIEQDMLVDYLRELKEIQVRGTTLPSKTLTAILESVPFFAEFGIGVAAAPETFGGSLSASGLALSKAAGKKAARKAVDKALKNAAVETTMTGTKKAVSLSSAKQLYKTTYDNMLKSGSVKAAKEVGAKEAAKITLKNTPENIMAANFGSKPLTYMTAKNTVGGVADRQLSGSMYVTDAGEAIFKEPENLALSIMKSFGSAIFDNYTETMGWAFAPVTSYFAKPIKNVLPKKFFTEFEKVVTSRYGMPASQALKKYGYDGVIEEMGEELLNRFLCQTFGINGLEDYNFDGFMNNVFYANNPEQWAVEALSFAVMGGAAQGAIGAGSKVKEYSQKNQHQKDLEKFADLANKRIYSPEEFYLEQGIFKIDGSQSSAEQLLRQKFSENGIDKSTASEFFRGASELEIRNKLKDFIEDENKDVEKRRAKAVDFVAEKFIQNKSFQNKNKAKGTANLIVTALEKLSETTNTSIEDVIRDETPTIISNEEQAVGNRDISNRLNELEKELYSLTENEENFNEQKFNEVSDEYNQLVEMQGQGQTLYQRANVAGAESGEQADATIEWQAKGTESEYFKKWFGDSKVIDENGQPLVVYHGAASVDIEEFNANEPIFGKNGIYFSGNKKVANAYKKNRTDEGKIYPVYLKMDNPYIYDCNGRSYNEIYDILRGLPFDESDYDGVILKNIDDNPNQWERGEIADTYVVFDSKQIKSVKNQGTFDSKNTNIYYQSAYHGSPHNFNEFSTKNIGSGQGAQTHGWGLYFSANKEVAEYYRNMLRGVDEQSLEGAKVILVQLNECLKFLKNKKNKISEAAKDLYNSMEYRYENKNDFKLDLQDSIEGQQKYIKNLEEKFKKEGVEKSQVFKVDVPEDNVLLDENKSFSKQSEKVKNILRNSGLIFFKVKDFVDFKSVAVHKEINVNKLYETENYGNAYSKYLKNPEILQNAILEKFEHGKDVYDAISHVLGSKKETSLKLNKLGIKGIKYDGAQDGECYVVFDDKAVEVLKTYYQEGEQQNIFPGNRAAKGIRNVKGSYMPAENLISLFKDADESTIIHEFAHWWLDRLDKYSKNNEELALDLDAVRKFVKNNGEEFTQEQHEKFARGFEAYIRNGSARNNRLKRIFEDFKNALLSIYDSLKQIMYREDGDMKTFSDDDVKTLESLFERLLTTENQRIQDKIFDKCDAIEDKIQEIKDNQSSELKELDKIYQGNISAINRSSDQKRQVDEYLDLAERAVSREPKELKEYKKRYKNITLTILEIATGYDRRFIANSRNWEKVQEKIANIDDPFSSSDGMLPEWYEFYSDTGVSYENQEVGGDYELAQQAFYVLASNEYNLADYQDAEINRFYGKFDYLFSKVKSLKGEEKATALEAIYTIFSDMPSMPNEVTEDLIEKLQSVGEIYEEQQKEDFNKKYYPSIPIVQQLQMYVTRKLQELKVYNPDAGYKTGINKSHSLYKLIKGATSVNSAKKIVRRINEYVIDDLQQQQKRILHKEIQKQVKVNSKLVRVGTIRQGKFDWKTNTIFAELAELNKIKNKEAMQEYLNLSQVDKAHLGEDRDDFKENPIETSDVKVDFQSILKRKFLEYRSQNIRNLNVAHTRSVLEDILSLKFEGRRAKSEAEFNKRVNRYNFENNLVQSLVNHKNNKIANFGTKWIVGSKTLSNWESILNAVFDNETAQEYSLLKDEADAEVYARNKCLYFYDRAAEIYGFKPANAAQKALDFDNIQPLVDLFQEYEKETYMYKETTFNKETGKFTETQTELSKAQMITLYAWSLNEELEQRIMTQFGVSQVMDMFENKLSEQDRQLAWAMIDACENMYEDTNEVFIRTLGLSLPHVENYFPSKTERIGSDIDMLHEFIVKSNNPSFIKQRKKCNRIKMSPQSPLAILLPHINKTARYIVLSEKVNFYNKIFQAADIKAVIKEVYGSKDGDKIHRALLNQLAASTFTSYARGVSMLGDVFDKASKNYITSSIGGSVKVSIGQLLSMINYAENMPAHIWAKGFAQSLINPVGTFNYMFKNCEYLQSRLAGNTQNEIIAILTSETDKFRTLKNFCTLNVKWGDIIAITLGGKPYVDYLISQGVSEKEAFDRFIKDTLRAQQAGLNSATSEWQKEQARNVLTRMFFAFRNTDMQYERKYIDSLIRASKGDITKKQLIKNIAIYKILNPIMFLSFLQNMSLLALFRSIFGGDDPEEIFGNFGKDIAMSIGLSGLNAYGFAGYMTSSFVQIMYSALDKEYKSFDASVPILSDFEKVLKLVLVKEEVELPDWIDAIAFTGDIVTGAPVAKGVNIVEGMGDAIQGEYGIGLSRMTGWGRYTATKAWTGEKPKKR